MDTTPNNFVFFWRPNEKNGHFSQWYLSNFVVDGVEYVCAEQYMMAKKAVLFGDTSMHNRIMRETDPAKHQQLGRRVANFVADVWNANCRQIVFQASVAKFSQNEHLQQLLLGTGDKILVEASPKDKIWGIGLDRDNPDALHPSKWKGTNFLGEALMQARKIIVEQSSANKN